MTRVGGGAVSNTTDRTLGSALARSFTERFQSRRFLHAGSRVSVYLLVQGLVQAAALLSGLVVVRSLTKQDFALYTIANALTGGLAVASDIGITSSLSAIGGRVAPDPGALGRLLATGFTARRRLILWSAPVLIALAVALLLTHGADPAQAAILLCLVLLNWYLQVNIGVTIIIPRLLGQIGKLQQFDLAGTFVRLGAMAGLALFHLSSAFALAASGLGFLVQAQLMERLTKRHVQTRATADIKMLAEVNAVTRSLLPTAIFYLVQGQLTLWIISVFGKTESVADFGALTRLSIILVPFGALMTNVIAPRLSRHRDSRNVLGVYLSLVILAAAAHAVMILPLLFYPEFFLMLLGTQYEHLVSEFQIASLLTAFYSQIAVMWTLNLSRAWTNRAWLQIPITLVVQALLATRLDVSSVRGVLWFGIVSAIPFFLLQFWFAIGGARADRLRLSGQSAESVEWA